MQREAVTVAVTVRTMRINGDGDEVNWAETTDETRRRSRELGCLVSSTRRAQEASSRREREEH